MNKIITAATLIVLFSVAPAFAHCGMCGVGEEKGSMKGDMTESKVKMLTEKLGLSGDQAAKLQTILDEKMAKKAAAKEQKKAAMEAIREEYQIKLKGILTPEQSAKYEAMKAEKEADHKHKGSMMHDDKGSKGSMKEKKGSK